MKDTTANRDVLQERTEELMKRFTSDEILGGLTSPDDLRNYLEKGFNALLNTAMLKEREMYLQEHPEDRGNGYAPSRSVKVKTTPVEVERPRTRGDFYPAMLPRYQRHIPSEYQHMLERILLDSKSFSAALRTMKALGMSYSEKELESLLSEIETEAETFHNRRLEPDWIALYIDAKVIDLKDEHNQVKKAIHFLVVGINFEGRKEIICSRIYWGNEKIECWKNLFIDLKKRGLTRLLLMVTDDFSGLKKLIAGFWSLSDHQLCTVHLLRNAQRQLKADDYSEFTRTWSEIIVSSSLETAREKWLALLDQLREDYPSWVKHLQERTDQYLQFMNYPSQIRKHIKSTNLPEGINNLIETVSRNAGGHFHTQRELNIKMKLMIDNLSRNKWKNPNPMFKHNLPSLMRRFKERFEGELPPDHFLTQYF